MEKNMGNDGKNHFFMEVSWRCLMILMVNAKESIYNWVIFCISWDGSILGIYNWHIRGISDYRREPIGNHPSLDTSKYPWDILIYWLPMVTRS
jgi:hypothetical protein